ncbi:hypothetical protein IC229_19020 [Spirosoma sp. BT702]|uniref:Uncharacterized protein n=1 Tax=Spirosoma profusum TaxID=2771354 RepID=A0A927AU69_9BACT|nr:hypothetical protein [Spirosoma profusum]MBD2702747.1 hypothetical protein [Spirosoma profusum]
MRSVLLSCLVLLCATTFTWAQGSKHPAPTTVYIPTNTPPPINYKYHDGVALLRDGTLLKGRFQSNGRSNFTYRATSQATRQKIGASMIRRLALAGADTLVTNRRDSTIFFRFGNRLYRQLTDGATMILDRMFVVDEDRGKIGYQLYVLDENDDLHKFTSLNKLNKWFYDFQEKSGRKLSDAYLNQNEIVKAVAQLNQK